MPKRRHFWSVVRRLRKRFPTPFPVRVVFMPMELAYGTAELVGDDPNRKFLIHLDSRLTEFLLVHFVIHEWAHCLRWDFKHEFGEVDWPGHDHAWAAHYCDLFRFIFDGDK